MQIHKALKTIHDLTRCCKSEPLSELWSNMPFGFCPEETSCHVGILRRDNLQLNKDNTSQNYVRIFDLITKIVSYFSSVIGYKDILFFTLR